MTASFGLLRAALADRYRIEREIGSGGMATVYLAEDVRHHRKVAVKVLRPELAATLGPERFLREIEVAAGLQHPNILALLDSGDEGGFLYYVMPYVDAPSLRERLANQVELPIHDVVRILAEVVDALAEAHRKGIVHRDVKPDNVLFTGKHALVTDFGVAKAVNDATSHQQLTTVGVALGTPAYMAPEQIVGDTDIDHRVDIYAVGAMAYEMLTGSPVFPGLSGHAVMSAHLTQQPQPLRLQRPAIPVALEALVMKCLAKQPSERWQSAEELLAQLETFQTPSGGVTPLSTPARRFSRGSIIAFAAAAAVVLVLAGIWLPRLFGGRGRWVREHAIPEIERHVEQGEWQAAYLLAKEAQEVAPDDSLLAGLWPTFSRQVRIETDPAGATVLRKAYSAADTTWEELGASPVTVRYPWDPSRLRIQLAGFRTLDLAVEASDSVMRFKLDTPEMLPEEMVRVTGWAANDLAQGATLGDFFIDRYEVTNRQYKAFVDSGGYRRREFWQHPFARDGRTLTWEEGVAHLTDRTGRAGPSTWEVGDYPSGQDDYPVSGVSWYEAAAYARFAGKELPSIYHWRRAFGTAHAWVVPASNVENDGPARVGQYQGLTRYGTLDMAGNVREWCFNAAGDQRIILGGGWNDPDYLAMRLHYSQPPFDRSPTNGFRLVKYLVNDQSLERSRQPVVESTPIDFLAAKPVADDIFAVYRRMYSYDKTPLAERIETADTTPNWIRQKISFAAAYGNERVILYLYLPKAGQPPFQTVVYFPGSAATVQRSIDQWRTIHLDFAIKSGRAFAFPIYKGTFERGDGTTNTGSSASNASRELFLQWAKDMSRSIDYLETRSDIDASKLAYYGYSWGGRVAPTLLAVEPRFKAAILYVAGIASVRPLPEIDELNFLPRVTLPVLMLTGRFDQVFPLETSAKPMFQLLGTAPEHKRHVISDGGHFVPRPQQIRETLNWLDRYLGPVR